MDLQERVAALEKQIRDLKAIEGIRDTIARYAWGIDGENWGELEDIFTEDAVLDHTMWRGVTTTGRQAIVNFFKQSRAVNKFTNRMSNLNERITVKGDTGTGDAYFLYMYTRDGESWIGWGRYRWEFRFGNSIWRISKMTLLPNTVTTLKKGWAMEEGRLPKWSHDPPVKSKSK